MDGQLISSIGKGLLVFAAIGKDDTKKEAESMASKILKAKFWDDAEGGRWKHNVQDIGGEVLCGMTFLFHIVGSYLTITSFPVHSLCFHEEGQQA